MCGCVGCICVYMSVMELGITHFNAINFVCATTKDSFFSLSLFLICFSVFKTASDNSNKDFTFSLKSAEQKTHKKALPDSRVLKFRTGDAFEYTIKPKASFSMDL